MEPPGQLADAHVALVIASVSDTGWDVKVCMRQKHVVVEVLERALVRWLKTEQMACFGMNRSRVMKLQVS